MKLSARTSLCPTKKHVSVVFFQFNERITCPTCQTVMRVPFDGLKTNYELKTMVNILRKQQLGSNILLHCLLCDVGLLTVRL